ncbi:SMI1/KNR4 family protein [Erwinia sorbitola]|uniref:SMI1/KNR4 family protein n=1 Tax=Erwinia sorbitola TaxID=2681984 RepID=A0ABW9RHD0_9GAMM|nr:SMI1/KNR4 family protein [Erwinia sorbitola]MTD29436.1 SMI1/KNR4 family protein [Erwinia sorbitola]
MLIIEESEKKLSQDDFFEFESFFRRELPEEFKRFYLTNNGGYLPENFTGYPFLFNGFISIKYGKAPIEKTYCDLITGFPQLKNLIPFADDSGGNCFLLSLRDEDYGKIYIWLMDEKKLIFVSDSFKEFIDELSQVN